MSNGRCAAALTALLLTTLLVAESASASAGVHEINQTCAVHTGCGAIDTPGFPVTLEPGNYRLTSDLVVPAGLLGIVEGGGNGSRRIDLGGFLIDAERWRSPWASPTWPSATDASRAPRFGAP